ncbi:MAG: lipase family protein [Acidimicrobiales bacterium]|jgi:fermentation-respiration switch protein FrsA (DUF1100 family)|nr:lipase family protein [Acidimicrobiales bacterium]
MHRRTRTARWVALVVGLALVGGACSSTGDDSSTATTAAPTATLAPPVGLPAFYGVPDPLPPGEPGDLIAAERLDVAGVNGTTWRVMYHSESVQGEDIAVTGLIVVPSSPAPEGGYPVVSWAHGTEGLADTCAPSLDADELAPLANPLLDAGYLVTASDFEGLGTPGLHPYIVGDSEARGTIDSVRAARNLPDLDVSDRYVVWGHSQGGHAAMFTLDIGEEWAPELQQLGVVAGAPPSQLLLINAALQTSPYRHYIAMVAAAINAAYGDEAAPLDEVLTPAGLDLLDEVGEACTGDLAAQFAGVDMSTLQKADPATVPTWNALLRENDPGTFTTPATAPLLIIHGGSDEQIPVASSALLFDQMCAIGQVTQRWVYPDQTHGGVVTASFADMLRWIDDRFAGESAPDPYQPVGPPVPETQSCPPT